MMFRRHHVTIIKIMQLITRLVITYHGDNLIIAVPKRSCFYIGTVYSKMFYKIFHYQNVVKNDF